MQVDFRDSLQINTGEEYITHSQEGVNLLKLAGNCKHIVGLFYISANTENMKKFYLLKII